MKISILHQYPGFETTVFYRLLEQECKSALQITRPEKANLVIYGPFARTPKIVGRFVKRKAVVDPLTFKKRANQPLSVFHTIENVRYNGKYDYSIGYDFPKSEREFRFPYWMEAVDWSHEGVKRAAPPRTSRLFTIAELQRPLGRFTHGRNGKCAAFFGQLREPRPTLLAAAEKHLTVDAFGPAFDTKIKNPQSSGVFKDDVLRDYSYNLCPENSLYPGYYTEKVLEGFASGCLPLTWADQNISADFNPDAFVNLLDFAQYNYEGWHALLQDKAEIEKFESAALLRTPPSIDPLRQFVKRIVGDIR